ncbi:MAG: hypothetical protein ACN6QT_06015 [Burkholderia contaminans]|uniref:Uncharacterized protein n=1 Tax=Burkholderia aenigmatica TaxID=2015348 RepID=A0A228HP04_9BURK|nr:MULTISPECIES: hypothetical protein [Burkholderia cepacia complex]KVR79827.1 hypothetical protein WK24_30495 [Burkholderia vietnamiensis]KVS19426.1 hypothetical protein WK32_21490 [Burkholderia vietnamiensis]MBR8009196.1 hypothetical protein [Burkholderia vietnamiensis]MBR8151505.1 hypothetical protein [Burkholderia vietnamiensis]MBR8164637.1 hypothetical protein [Burkholderia vietnamiensis]
MFEVLEQPVRPLDGHKFDGKTVEEVARYLEQALRAAGLQPEWVIVANQSRYANEAVFGRKPQSQWPIGAENQRRSSVSIQRGMAEGWIVHIDTTWRDAELGVGHWRTQPLIRMKTLTRSHAWAIAAVVSNLLDID